MTRALSKMGSWNGERESPIKEGSEEASQHVEDVCEIGPHKTVKKAIEIRCLFPRLLRKDHWIC